MIRRTSAVLLRCAALVIFICPVFKCVAADDRVSWPEYGGGPTSSHFVPSNQVNKSNVSRLSVAWSYPTRDNASYVFNPVVADNVMYVLARNTALIAIDATTGKEIWVHEGLAGVAQRGNNYWQSTDRKDRRLVFQIHNQLQEIDAVTGNSILSFGKNGFVDLRAGLGRESRGVPRIQSGTPGKIFENLIILGSSTGENFISPPGDIRAYDVLTGKLVWQFILCLIPANSAMTLGRKTLGSTLAA